MTYNYKILFIAIIICMCMPVMALTEEPDINESLEIGADDMPIIPIETPVPEETPILPNVPKYISGDEPIDDGNGGLFIHVSCGHNIFSREMTIQRTNITLPFYEEGNYYETNTPFTNGNRIPKDYFDKIEKVGEPRNIELNLGGFFEDKYAPGVYAITLKDGNNGQPEYALAALYHKGNTYINFIGHAVSMVSIDKTKETPIPSECPLVVSFDWYGPKKLFLKFNIENTNIVNKWVTLQYIVRYDRQIRCLEENRLIFEQWQGPQKCYEPTTITETLILPRYAPNGISSHIGIIDYTGVHKEEELQSVSVISCKDAYTPKPKEPTPS